MSQSSLQILEVQGPAWLAPAVYEIELQEANSRWRQGLSKKAGKYPSQRDAQPKKYKPISVDWITLFLGQHNLKVKSENTPLLEISTSLTTVMKKDSSHTD